MSAKEDDKFRFRDRDIIGIADAEQDKKFLSQCFIDTGDVEILADYNDHRFLVMGRTGAGKTALLTRLQETEERVISIPPDSLALTYITNSTILSYIVKELGVRLDPFYKLLWRHVFTVEILRAHFNIYSINEQRGFLDRIREKFLGQKNAQALKYLEEWGESFWQTTDYRITETTTKLESKIKGALGAKYGPLSSKIESGQSLSEEEKKEYYSRAQQVVNDIQISQLANTISLLGTLLTDPQKRYYIVIDRLDEDWVEDRFRYQLIRALIEAARDFNLEKIKVIVALRLDLVDRVYAKTRDPGFQVEKYESLNLNITWSQTRLTELLDKRIDYLVKSRYTKARVTHRDLLPKKVDGIIAIDYIMMRTLMRPRDVIDFFNKCIAQAANSPKIDVNMMKQAEADYSRSRLLSIVDEWLVDYPNLHRFFDILKQRPARFYAPALTDKDCEEYCLSVAIQDFDRQDELSLMAMDVATANIAPSDFRRTLLSIFYRVGLVAMKLESHEAYSMSYIGRRTISPGEITDRTHVAVHPLAWRSLGINPTRAELN